MGFRPGKVVYFAIWHIDPTLRHFYRRARTRRGILPLELMEQNHIHPKHYIPLSTAEPFVVQLMPMYDEDHVDPCVAEQNYYSKLASRNAHLKPAISEIMIGKYSINATKSPLHPHSMYHPYSPVIQRMLRSCHATQIIPLLAESYCTPPSANPNEGNHTMSHAIHSYKEHQKKQKPKDRDRVSMESQVRGVLPFCFMTEPRIDLKVMIWILEIKLERWGFNRTRKCGEPCTFISNKQRRM